MSKEKKKNNQNNENLIYDRKEVLEKLRYLRAFIVLAPCFIVCILNIYMNVEIHDAIFRLLITIVAFFVVGTVVIKLIDNVISYTEVDEAKEEKEDEDEIEEQEQDEETSTEKHKE